MTVERRYRAGPPWLLPVLLALIIAAVVLGIIFVPRLTSSSSPTATPPATATGAAAPTSTAGSSSGTAIPPTATPGGQGGATPLPSASPQPTIGGLTIGEITHTQKQVADTQASVDRGDSRYVYYLDPRQVVQNTLPQYGFTQTSSFEIVSPNPNPTPTPYADSNNLGRPTVKFIVSYRGQTFTVFVSQVGKRGPKGIWLIVTIYRGNV